MEGIGKGSITDQHQVQSSDEEDEEDVAVELDQSDLLASYQKGYDVISAEKIGESSWNQYTGQIRRLCIWLFKFAVYHFCLDLTVNTVKGDDESWWRRLKIRALTADPIRTYLGFYVYQKKSGVMKSKKTFEAFCSALVHAYVRGGNSMIDPQSGRMPEDVEAVLVEMRATYGRALRGAI